MIYYVNVKISFLFLILPQNLFIGRGPVNEIPLLRIPQVRFGDCNLLKIKADGVYQICLNLKWWRVVKPLGAQDHEITFLSWRHHFTDQIECVALRLEKTVLILCFWSSLAYFHTAGWEEFQQGFFSKNHTFRATREPNGWSWASQQAAIDLLILPKCRRSKPEG